MIKFLNKYLYRNKKIQLKNTEDQLSVWTSKDYEVLVSEKNIPKIIWSYWHEGGIPKSIKCCIESWKYYNSDYEIRFLNKNTIKEYLPDFIFEDYSISNPVFFCDLIRLKLLEKYGGIYLDASVFLNSSVSVYLEHLKKENLDLLCFKSFGHPNDDKFPITESWFLISESNNEFIKKWFDILNNAFKQENPELFFKTSYNNYYLSVSEDKRDYFFIYIASQYVMRNVENIKIGFLNSKYNGFTYNYFFKHDYYKIAKYLLLETNYNKFPTVIKLINKNRLILDKLIDKNLYKKKSMFGKFLK
ncbi:glycosyltransferase family 32 protein [Empedobacter falsenii]